MRIVKNILKRIALWGVVVIVALTGCLIGLALGIQATIYLWRQFIEWGF